MTTGYLKTPPGLLTSISVFTNLIAFVCVLTSESKDSIHAGFLLAVTIIGFLSSIVIILCHVIQGWARRIPPYPFALFQVCIFDLTTNTGFMHPSSQSHRSQLVFFSVYFTLLQQVCFLASITRYRLLWLRLCSATCQECYILLKPCCCLKLSK